MLADQRQQFGVFNDDWIDGHSGLKADFVESAQVGRVGNGNREAVAPLVERYDPVCCHQLAINGRNGNMAFVEGVQVEKRITESLGDKSCNIECRSLLAGDDLFNEWNLGRVCLGDELFSLGFLEPSSLNECSCQSTDRLGLRCCSH